MDLDQITSPLHNNVEHIWEKPHPLPQEPFRLFLIHLKWWCWNSLTWSSTVLPTHSSSYWITAICNLAICSLYFPHCLIYFVLVHPLLPYLHCPLRLNLHYPLRGGLHCTLWGGLFIIIIQVDLSLSPCRFSVGSLDFESGIERAFLILELKPIFWKTPTFWSLNLLFEKKLASKAQSKTMKE